MKNRFSKILILLTLLALLFTILAVAVSAANPTGYDSADDVKYNKDGNYVYNWGVRGETATFLSSYAEKFYTGSYVYDTMSELSGGTGTGNAPSSALYKQLQALMQSKHSKQTSYAATRDLYQYTDCEAGGGKISSFYSGVAIGPAWGQGNWNREHTWPNSKGLEGNDENDIMMLRPTATSENSSRGNTAYGQSTGYYHPNSESGGKYDLRGDVARICLYVYVRWGNTGKMWGKSGVMESLNVLLTWMEEDPVDTWEMGRNDAVQSITGTRNVFVDYPEYAWLLFGEEIPSNLETPSGEGGNQCKHQTTLVGVVQATCTVNGYTGDSVCSLCGVTVKKGTTITASHSFSAYVETKAPTCTVAGEKTRECSVCHTKQTISVAATGHSYGAWSITVEPRCTDEGEKTRECTKCDAVETATVAATGHAMGAFVVTTVPTCTEPGVKTQTCNNCVYSVTEPVAATGHTMGAWKPVSDPVCETAGEAKRECENCDYFETDTVDPTGHTFGEWIIVIAPTCTEAGTKKRECENCDESENGVAPATGHTLGEWETTTAPTCTEAGIQTRNCENCDYHENGALGATGHSIKEYEAKAPTHSSVGWEAYEACEGCDYTTYVEIPMIIEIDAFKSAVSQIDLTAYPVILYEQISLARELYRELREDEKALVTEEISKLNEAIATYNAAKDNLNSLHYEQNAVALAPVVLFFTFISLFLALIEKHFNV